MRSPHVGINQSFNRSIRLLGLPALVLMACCAIPAAAEPVAVRVLQDDADSIVLGYTIAGFGEQAVEIDGVQYTAVSLGEESLITETGSPSLPNVCRSIIIPNDAEMAVSVLSSSFYDIVDIDVPPSKGHILRTIDPKDVPFTFGPVYQQDSFFPDKPVSLREPYILRDHRGVVVEVNPFQYNPVARTLRVYTELVVEVSPVGPARVNALHVERREADLSLTFHSIYQSHFLNYEAGQRYTPLNEVGEMLIICHDAWLSNIQPFAEHKNAIGIDTTVVPVSEIGNNATAIKNYIQGVYDSGNLAFVLLVGDGAQVDTPYASGGSSDPSYSKLAGGDNYPDILVGRFSAETAGQVDTQVQRTMAYELLPATGEDWFKRGMGVASNQGPGDDGEYDNEHLDNIRADLLGYGYTQVDQIYDPSGSASQVTSALNAGRGVINYTGHGSTTSWSTTGFSNSHVNALTNDSMLPFICSVACVNGNFDGPTCFAEAWLRATNGSAPTGAIGAYMSSINQSWNPPMDAQDEFVDLLVGEAYFSFGALSFAGSCHMMDEYGSSGVEMFDTWHLFGDPSVRVFGVAVLPPLRMSLPEGVPTLVDGGVPTPIKVQIESVDENFVPGTGLLHCRFGAEDYVAVPVTPMGGDLYEAVLPAAECDTTPEFYFSATGDGGSTIVVPEDAPNEVFSVMVGTFTTILEDDFESGQDWTVVNGPGLSDGQWVRGFPLGGGDRGDPPSDFDGSGKCFLTDLVDGDSDVDGGFTWLTSPRIDASMGDAEISFALWYTNYAGAYAEQDVLNIHLSDNDGADWVLVETVGPATESGWTEYAFMVGDFVTPTGQIRVRIEVSDLGGPSIVEAGLDAFGVSSFECAMPATGDFDEDGDLDLSDFQALQDCFGHPALGACAPGNLFRDDLIDINDFALFAADVTGPQ